MAYAAKPTCEAPGIPYWVDRMRAEGIGDALIDEMARQPRFAEAAYHHIRRSVEMQADNPMVSRLAKGFVPLVLGYLALYMAERGNLSRQAVRDLCSELGISSPGRAAAMVAHMRFIKFIEPDPNPVDKRTKLYVPTQGMKRAFIDVMSMGMEATELVEPQMAKTGPLLNEAQFFKGYVLALGDSFVELIRKNAGVEPDMFARASHGYFMIYKLVLGVSSAVYPPEGPLPFVKSALASEFKIARSHVGRTFDKAKKMGFVSYGEDRKSLTFEEPFRRQLVRNHAAMLLNNIRCVWMAHEYTQGRPTTVRVLAGA